VVFVRRVVFAALVMLFLMLAAVFAYSNPEPVDVDIGVVKFEQVSKSIAFAAAFVLGWVFGLISAGLALLRTAGEKRRLRKELTYVESELSAAREPPLPDAH
jgi:uncharacterized integral membrane protein